MKKIALIEPLKHYEVLASILRILSGEAIEIHCFTNSFCRSQIGSLPQEVKLYVCEEDKMADNFLSQYLDILNTCDLVFFTTIDLHSRFLIDTRIQTKTAALVHNANNFFLQNRQQIANLPKYIYHKLRGDFKTTTAILNKLDRVVAPTASIANYLQKKLKNHREKLRSIEVAIPEYTPQILDRPEIFITIPGTVNQDRRDYSLIAAIIPEVDRRIDCPVKLVFLGQIFSKREKAILDQLKSQALKHFDIVTFEGYVSIEDFKSQMQVTDFLLLPIQKEITYKSLKEERGKTCISGNINDMVQFALPVILPAFYPLNEKIEPLVARFETKQDLEEKMVEWILKKRFNEIKKSVTLDDYLHFAKINLKKGLL